MKFVCIKTDGYGFKAGQLFEIVEEPEPGYVRVKLPSGAISAILNVVSFHFDIIEGPITDAFPIDKSTVCPCGIHRADCDYHR